MSAPVDRFAGAIAAGAFASGDAVVVGLWRASPFGRVVDVMWVRASGERVFLASSPELRAYVLDLYTFDRGLVVPVHGGWDGAAVAVVAGPLRLRLEVGPRDWRSWLFALRPGWLRRRRRWLALEDAVARPLVGRLLGGAEGVRALGRAPGGQRERYAAADWRPVVHGALQVDGSDAGALVDLPPALGIGLSSFPRRPALVHVETFVEHGAGPARG